MHKERAIIFIDARNIIQGEKDYRNSTKDYFSFGYQEMMNFFSNRFNVIRAYYYDGAPHRDQRTKERQRLYMFMRQLGITLRLKEVDFNKPHASQKGVDIYLTSDMISLAFENAYDIAILFSGDGDYVALIDLVKSKGKRVWVVSFECCISQKLRECADKVLLIEKTKGLNRQKKIRKL